MSCDKVSWDEYDLSCFVFVLCVVNLQFASCMWYFENFWRLTSTSKFPCESFSTHSFAKCFFESQVGRIFRIIFSSFILLAPILRKNPFSLFLSDQLFEKYFPFLFMLSNSKTYQIHYTNIKTHCVYLSFSFSMLLWLTYKNCLKF